MQTQRALPYGSRRHSWNKMPFPKRFVIESDVLRENHQTRTHQFQHSRRRGRQSDDLHIAARSEDFSQGTLRNRNPSARGLVTDDAPSLPSIAEEVCFVMTSRLARSDQVRVRRPDV